MKEENLQEIIEQFVDLLAPQLTPYEAMFYIILIRNSHLTGTASVRIGKRTLADRMGAVRGAKTNYAHVTKLVAGLEEKGCIKIGDTNREGTLYDIFLPKDIPSVKEKLAVVSIPENEDYFTKPEKRKEIFERDRYTCIYCGEKVTSENATLDHMTPQYKGGKHTKENLKTCCLMCNSIKSGKTYEEAAPLLLKSIQERRTNS